MKAQGRIIRVMKSIDSEAFQAFSVEMNELLKESTTPITVELFSEGGDAHAALAFSGMIRTCPAPITIKAYGYVASAAVLLLAAGKHRVMTREAWVMVHEDSGTFDFDSVTSAERDVKQYRALEHQWCSLLADYTGTSAETWADLHKETTYLSAEACKKLGLVDRVI